MPAIIPIPAFRDNYVWALREGRSAAVVDPGDAEPVLAWLERESVVLTGIVVTHHHGDHVGGVRTLTERFRVPVFGPAREDIPCRTEALGEGERIDVPGVGLDLAVLDVPGHTAGHIAYVGNAPDGPVLFCGDTLFAAGCGRLFEGTAAEMFASLRKLADLAPATRVYCAHEYTLANLRFALAVEPDNAALHARIARDQATRDRGEPTLPSTIAEERLTNPFLRTAVPAVAAAAARHAGRELATPVDAFAELRRWKNAF
jgi:hydroxyacylglutathione hydrolase